MTFVAYWIGHATGVLVLTMITGAPFHDQALAYGLGLMALGAAMLLKAFKRSP